MMKIQNGIFSKSQAGRQRGSGSGRKRNKLVSDFMRECCSMWSGNWRKRSSCLLISCVNAVLCGVVMGGSGACFRLMRECCSMWSGNGRKRGEWFLISYTNVVLYHAFCLAGNLVY